MRSITWPVHRRFPKTTRNNFVTPNCLFTIQLRWRLREVYIRACIPMLKRFSVAKKQSKSVPKMVVFRKFKGPNIKYSQWDPKRHFLTQNDVIWRILRKYPFRGVGCSLIEELQKTNEKLTPKARQNIAYLGNRNPWTDRYKILHAGCRPGHNHACQFWWRSVKGFWCGEGSNFGLSHWLASSPSKHSLTTVRVWYGNRPCIHDFSFVIIHILCSVCLHCFVNKQGRYQRNHAVVPGLCFLYALLLKALCSEGTLAF